MSVCLLVTRHTGSIWVGRIHVYPVLLILTSVHQHRQTKVPRGKIWRGKKTLSVWEQLSNMTSIQTPRSPPVTPILLFIVWRRCPPSSSAGAELVSPATNTVQYGRRDAMSVSAWPSNTAWQQKRSAGRSTGQFQGFFFSFRPRRARTIVSVFGGEASRPVVSVEHADTRRVSNTPNISPLLVKWPHSVCSRLLTELVIRYGLNWGR